MPSPSFSAYKTLKHEFKHKQHSKIMTLGQRNTVINLFNCYFSTYGQANLCIVKNSGLWWIWFEAKYKFPNNKWIFQTTSWHSIFRAGKFRWDNTLKNHKQCIILVASRAGCGSKPEINYLMQSSKRVWNRQIIYRGVLPHVFYRMCFIP